MDQIKHIPKGFAKYLLNGCNRQNGRICTRRRLCYARKFVFNIKLDESSMEYDKFS